MGIRGIAQAIEVNRALRAIGGLAAFTDESYQHLDELWFSQQGPRLSDEQQQDVFVLLHWRPETPASVVKKYALHKPGSLVNIRSLAQEDLIWLDHQAVTLVITPQQVLPASFADRLTTSVRTRHREQIRLAEKNALLLAIRRAEFATLNNLIELLVFSGMRVRPDPI